MASIVKFVDKAKGFGSLVLYSTLPNMITANEFWMEFLPGAASFLVEQGIKYGMKIKKYKQEILPLMEELFLEGLQETRRETVIGLRYETKPSDWDKLAGSRTFAVPLVLKFEQWIKRKPMEKPRLPSSNMSPIYIGGWRPIREVESILRKTPFIFGILREDEKVYIPSEEELEEDIRKNPDKIVRWVVCEAEGRKLRNWWAPEYRQDGRPKSDLVIITRSTNPFNPEIGALVISGTHREGTLGGALLTSHPELLNDFYKLPEVSKYLHARYQAVVRLHFNDYSLDKPKSLWVRKIDWLAGSKL